MEKIIGINIDGKADQKVEVSLAVLGSIAEKVGGIAGLSVDEQTSCEHILLAVEILDSLELVSGGLISCYEILDNLDSISERRRDINELYRMYERTKKSKKK